jgi:hypothetical protein
MKNKMITFPEIGQFRQIIKLVTDNTRYSGRDENGDAIYDATKRLPILTFSGTVKVHGTNAGVTLTKDGEMYAQSRENIITVEQDNAGFAFFVESNKNVFIKLFETLDIRDADYITIFGEWAGGSIQKGVAINGLPKMFIIFAVKLSYEDNEVKTNYFLTDDETKHLKNADASIFNILDFGTFSIDIDFERPELAQNKLIELTSEVERECPVGKAFGNIGTGEGIVWKTETSRGTIRFKVKGEKHSSSKVKTLASVDTEKVNSIKEFAEYAVTESRLEQGIEKVFTSVNEEIDIIKISNFLKWIVGDIIKEEMDTLKDNGLESKDVTKEISNIARKWFLNKWNLMK